MKINKDALYVATQVFMIAAGTLFAAEPEKLLIWQVIPVIRYYPVVNQWAFSLPTTAGPGMGWYGITAIVLVVSSVAMVISYAVAHAVFSRGRRLSPKLEIFLTVLSIAALITGVTVIGLNEYKEWVLERLIFVRLL